MDAEHVVRGRTVAASPLRPVLTAVSRVDFARRRTFAPHLHQHYELILPLRGCYRCRIGSAEVSARPGQAVLLMPGDLHEDPLAWPVQLAACAFRLEPAPDTRRSPALLVPEAAPGLRVLAASPAFAELSARIGRSLAGGDAYDWAALDAILGGLLWELARRLPSASVAPAFRLHAEAAVFAERARAVFAARLDRPVPVAVLAREAGMPLRAFAEGCRRHLGQSPLAAYTAARIDHAAALLAIGGIDVQTVAARLGFANPFHFSRVFRRHRGCAPSVLVP